MQSSFRPSTRISAGVAFGAFVLALAGALPLPAKDLATYNTEQLYSPERVIRIELQVAPADWDALRRQHRSLLKTLRTDVAGKDRDVFFDYFRAELSIDNVKIGPVAVRKKGFVGSLDRERPSLKIQLDKHDRDKRYAGVTTLTLNNNKQDPSALHQVIGCDVFRAAGLPAPRCNLAEVIVNGKSLGIYSNIESYDQNYFQQRFPGDKGTLWEGTVADFTEVEVQRFERKFGPKKAAEKLKAVVHALSLPDAEVIPALERVLDMDAFLRFWATEVLIGHWDGYASNRNNVFVYYHAGNDRLMFLPWGVDQLATDQNFLWGDPTFVPPKSVKAASEITLRLYNLPAARKRYFATLRKLLNEAWDEPKLLKQMDALTALSSKVKTPASDRSTGTGGDLRAFVRQRRADIEKELSQPPPAWTLARREPIGEITKVGELDVQFTLTPPGGDGAEPAPAKGAAQVRLMFEGRSVTFDDPQIKLDRAPSPWGPPRWLVLISRIESDPQQPAAIEIGLFPGGPDFSAGGTADPLRVDVFASPAQARLLEPVAAGKTPQGLAAVAGNLKLIEWQPAPGGTIKAHLTGELFKSSIHPRQARR
jgi:hypothetical protein